MNGAKYLYINSRDELYRINIAKIVCFESEGNYTNIMMNNKMKGTVCLNLSKMQELLAANLKEASAVFARVGKRHIINLNYVFKIEVLRQRLVLSDGENFEYHLAVSKDALKKLKSMYTGEN